MTHPLRILTALALLAPWPCLAATAAEPAIPADGVMAFSILRHGNVIGEYRSVFTPIADGGVELQTTIEAAVSVGPVRLYHFQHSSTEDWRDGRLVALKAETDDDGETHRLRLRQEGDGLMLDIDGKKVVPLPATAVPSSLWNGAMLQDGRPLFDIADGQVAKIETHCAAEGTGRRCQVTGDMQRSLYYGPDGLLESLNFAADDGSEVTYVKAPAQR